MIKWITILLVLLNLAGFAQSDIKTLKKNYPDSSDFWVNLNYLECITSGNDVCDCLSKNEIVMVFLNYEGGKVIFQSSTYFFGLETTVELDLKITDIDKSAYIVEKQWPFTDSLLITVLDNMLTIDYINDKMKFEKQRLKTLYIPKTPKGIFNYDLEIWTQRNTLNSKSLLAYPYTDKVDQLFSQYELKRLIEDDKVTISCSDDFHYNSMWIKTDIIRYFYLEYDNNRVTIYEQPNGRNKGEELKLEGLVKQEFYKVKQK